ncbi:GNAT family N-acetyltransferase [Henriciella aquimarina]|uniref:GNAT family N-acetyltransferase n=1 Tax=Henriciella aquimarina TaxID=545261 RepID=UPI0009FC5F52|nr:N-acetyltransferase [Henriciella aquimarina]
MSDVWIRDTLAIEAGAVAALNTRVFGSSAEAAIIDQLNADSDSLVSLVAHDDEQLVGHIQFFRILVDGRDIAAGLGPMSVRPSRQRKGVGHDLIRLGMSRVERAGRGLVFVLGHTDYYSRFGFSPDVGARYEAPWSGPAFMGIELTMTAPRSGGLTYPQAFSQPQ